MLIGEKIRLSRKNARLTRDELAGMVGVSLGVISKIELNLLKFGPAPKLVVKIADQLNDKTILTTYLENNPVYQSIIPKIFTELNNIRREPAIIFSRFAAEAEEARQSALILAEIFSNADPRRSPNFEAVFKANLEQIVDVQRCAEILFAGLIAAGVMSDVDLRDAHERQQRKCEAHGHHRVEGAVQ